MKLPNGGWNPRKLLRLTFPQGRKAAAFLCHCHLPAADRARVVWDRKEKRIDPRYHLVMSTKLIRRHGQQGKGNSPPSIMWLDVECMILINSLDLCLQSQLLNPVKLLYLLPVPWQLSRHSLCSHLTLFLRKKFRFSACASEKVCYCFPSPGPQEPCFLNLIAGKPGWSCLLF